MPSLSLSPFRRFNPFASIAARVLPFIDNDGNFWRADDEAYFSGGTAYQECPKIIANTEQEDLYCSNRWFDTPTGGYQIPVSMPGTYSVALHFAEIYYAEPGARIFDIALEGTIVQTDLDIVQVGGGTNNVALTLTFDVMVHDKSLNIDLIKKVENPQINAIEVTKSTTSSSTFQPYVPGNLIVEQYGLLLSEGLSANLLATALEPVEYSNGTFSEEVMHTQPDAGACFVDPNPFNPGGWIYVSNSEEKPDDKDSDDKPAGVGAFTFDAAGHVIEYKRILNNTRANCGGGTTPWGSWISGEEYPEGQVWQVDPTGLRPAEIITMSKGSPGMFESFAHDIRNVDLPRFFVTKDDAFGELTRL